MSVLPNKDEEKSETDILVASTGMFYTGKASVNLENVEKLVH